jgi:hypothetical protein
MDVMTANDAAKEKPLTTIESEISGTPEPETTQPKARRKSTKKMAFAKWLFLPNASICSDFRRRA